MNCQDFETVIVEIARERLMDALARERGLEHADTCAHCAALLAEERALSARLRALSVVVAAEEIPAQIEADLLAAFRQHTTAPTLAPAVSNGRRWLLEVAALLLLGAGLSLAGWIASSPGQESALTTPTPRVNAPTPPLAGEAPEEQVRPQQTRHDFAAKSERRQKRWGSSSSRLLAEAAQPREMVTEFFPLIQGSELIPLEGGQIVRVRMPRANLIPLGIQFNQERANEIIQADVLVSNDGLARAMRLVY
jgi:hypothetical protein